jgi:hypothetical protein
MPADGVLDIDLACLRGSLRISQPADRTTTGAPACHPVVCVAPEGPQTSPFMTGAVPMPAGGVR